MWWILLCCAGCLLFLVFFFFWVGGSLFCMMRWFKPTERKYTCEQDSRYVLLNREGRCKLENCLAKMAKYGVTAISVKEQLLFFLFRGLYCSRFSSTYCFGFFSAAYACILKIEQVAQPCSCTPPEALNLQMECPRRTSCRFAAQIFSQLVIDPLASVEARIFL